MSMTEVRGPGGSAPSFTDPIAPLRIALRGHYEIERQIGQGAYATVYLARDLKHERKVAIKVLNADPTSETGEIRFIREIRLVARLQHPNILPLHDSGHVEALLYYVMPFVDGETLRIRMHRERQIAVEAAVAIARETADALAYAHKQGIVHRDIKPENILLSGSHAIVADFGIARAIDVGGVKQLTVTGVAGPGTPAYMSPEQLLGDRPVDARSDIYSLGCVLYEMLAARAPFPGKDGFVKRFTEPPPHISSLRRDVPGWIDGVVAKALAKDPGDRYATANDFVAALGQTTPAVRVPGRHTPIKHALVSPPMFASDPLEEQELSRAFPDSYPSRDPKERLKALVPIVRSRSQRWFAAARAHPVKSGVAALGILGIVVAIGAASRVGSFPAMFGGAPPLDSTRYALLGSMGAGPGALSIGSQISDSLYDALTKLEGSPVVPQSRVAQAITDGAPPPTTEAAAISLARRVGAGKAIWVQSSGTQQLPRVRVYLYDAASGKNLDELAVPASGRGEEYYAAAAYRLLGLGNRPGAAIGCDGRTRIFHAWASCSRGHIALANWDLPASERGFREALIADPAYAPARLWLGQLIAWRTPAKRSEWYDLVRRASESENLHPRDRLAATGLTAFSERRFPAACAAYREMIRLDSLDFLGWYGMGECQSSDNAVVESATSPSKWAFRSSSHSAVKAYMTALRIQPGAYEIFDASMLEELMPVSPHRTRKGLGGPLGRELFASFPTLEAGDTVGFVPYPIELFQRLRIVASRDAALRRNREALKEFTASWAERFPRSARAQEALADAFEARDELGDGPPSASAALRAIDSAVALVVATGDNTVKRTDVVRLRARKVRVHFKRGEFAAARSLADSILRTAQPESYGDLDWVAALTGRADQVAHYWQDNLSSNAGMSGGTVHSAVAGPANKYFAYAALGVCGPQLSNARAQLESALRYYITKDIRDSVRSEVADRATMLATPCTKAKNPYGVPRFSNKLNLAQQAFGRGDLARAREILIAADAERRGRRPGDTSADFVFQEAWLRTQVGDTTAAAASLDAALGALPTFGTSTFSDVGGAGAFPRAMLLRAEIAAKTGDVKTARRWTDALSQLWASADPPLRNAAEELVRALGPAPVRDRVGLQR